MFGMRIIFFVIMDGDILVCEFVVLGIGIVVVKLISSYLEI